MDPEYGVRRHYNKINSSDEDLPTEVPLQPGEPHLHLPSGPHLQLPQHRDQEPAPHPHRAPPAAALRRAQLWHPAAHRDPHHVGALQCLPFS